METAIHKEFVGNNIFRETKVTKIPLPDTVGDGEILRGDFDWVKEQIDRGLIHLKDMSEIEDYLTSSNPSDYILFTKDTHDFLNEYYHKLLKMDRNVVTETVNTIIPKDIFIANTIPLPDVVFRMPVYNDAHTRKVSDFYLRFIYGNDVLVIVVSNSREKNLSGAVRVIKMGDSYSVDGTNIYVNDINYKKYENRTYTRTIKLLTVGLANHLLADWYAFQILLLNPVIRDRMFTRSIKEKLRINDKAITGQDENQIKTRKRKAKYIRYNTINIDILSSNVVRNQYTLCWYVIGHYRHYSSGKKTWVNGYWKGPLRELQKNLDEGRERLLQQAQ